MPVETVAILTWSVLVGDALAHLCGLPEKSYHACVVSPPYWSLRDYGAAGQLGLEQTPAAYVGALVEVFHEVRRVLRDDGVLWLNVGDSYAGSWGAQSREHAGKHAPNISALSANHVKAAQKRTKTGSLDRTPDLKPKDLVGIPWRLAFALQEDGWYLRSDTIWYKPNPMPESVTDRPTRAHEYVFLLSKSKKYYYNAMAILRPLSPKTYTTFGIERTGYGDGSGLVKAENYGSTVPTRKPKVWGLDDYKGQATKDYEAEGVQNPSDTKRRILSHLREQLEAGGVTGANAHSVWSIGTEPSDVEHFAVMPKALARKCVVSACPPDGIVLDPFAGAGTTGVVALEEGRSFVGIELNPTYAAIARQRLGSAMPLFAKEA